MPHSADLNPTQAPQYPRPSRGWAPAFHLGLRAPPTHPLNPVIPDNARTPRITAAAGTELAGAYSGSTVKRPHVGAVLPAQKWFTTLSAVVPHAGWLGQGCPHCPIFLTAASRRSRVRVSVPVWGSTLSRPLPINGLVGRYPTNYLIGRTPLPHRIAPLLVHPGERTRPWRITPSFPGLSPRAGQVAYALLTRAPVSHHPKTMLPCDLHVLSLPLAFILSQDQTLHRVLGS